MSSTMNLICNVCSKCCWDVLPVCAEEDRDDLLYRDDPHGRRPHDLLQPGRQWGQQHFRAKWDGQVSGHNVLYIYLNVWMNTVCTMNRIDAKLFLWCKGFTKKFSWTLELNKMKRMTYLKVLVSCSKFRTLKIEGNIMYVDINCTYLFATSAV